MKFNLLFSLFLKALSMCLGFISIPLYIGYFGNDSVLGLWFSILSILTWTMYFDLGVGNGLKNEMIKLISDGSIAYARKLFIKSILFLSVFSFSLSFLVIAGFIVFYFWGSFEFKGIERDEFYLSMLVLAIAMFLQFPLKLGISCILSFQKSALSNVPLCLTQLLVVIYLYLMADIVSSKFFLYLSLFYAVSLVLPLSISLLYGLFLLKEGKTYNKVGGVSNRAFVDKVVFPGIGFFSIQILLLLVTGSNEFFILHLFGGEQVVEYQVYYRLYSIGLVFFTTLCIPFWGYLRKAYTDGSGNDIKKYTLYILFSLVLSILILLCLIVLNEYVFTIWIPESDDIYSFQANLMMLLYVLMIIFVNLSAVFTNSFGVLRYQSIGLLLSFIIKVTICIIYDWDDWSDIVFITALSLVPCVVLQIYCLFNKINLRKYYV